MITDTREKILKLVRDRGRVTAGEMAEYLEISRQGLYLQLAKMLQSSLLIKTGKPPKVYYQASEEKTATSESEIDKNDREFIEERYLYVTPLGEKLGGVVGFVAWCERTKQSVGKTAHEYVVTQKRYDKWKRGGVIGGMIKLKSTFPDVYLDKLYYLDFYSIERFGKTKLGQLLLYAKQSQNRAIIRELIELIARQIRELVKREGISSVAYIPPTVKREVQLMKELEKGLKLPLRRMMVSKIKAELAVPQKTLTKLSDRVENARKMIIVEGAEKHNNVLLIDDAVGSGATLNETAKQMRERNLVTGKIIGFSIVGSYKGFDVISEV